MVARAPESHPVQSRGIVLRSVAGVLLLAVPLTLGLLGRPLLASVACLVTFVLLKVVTGRRLWASTLLERGTSVLPAMIAATVCVQGVVVFALFGLGRLLGRAAGFAWPADTLGWPDAALILGPAFVHAVLMEVAGDPWLEASNEGPADLPSADADSASS